MGPIELPGMGFYILAIIAIIWLMVSGGYGIYWIISHLTWV